MFLNYAEPFIYKHGNYFQGFKKQNYVPEPWIYINLCKVRFSWMLNLFFVHIENVFQD